MFLVTRGKERERRTEGPGSPVVVGPTLFGYVLEHWDELTGGANLSVRFAVTDKARTYNFKIRRSRTDDDTTTISLTASSFFVRLFIREMSIVFDSRSKKVLRYIGRVPPRSDGLKSVFAHVSYDFAVAIARSIGRQMRWFGA